MCWHILFSLPLFSSIFLCAFDKEAMVWLSSLFISIKLVPTISTVSKGQIKTLHGGCNAFSYCFIWSQHLYLIPHWFRLDDLCPLWSYHPTTNLQTIRERRPLVEPRPFATVFAFAFVCIDWCFLCSIEECLSFSSLLTNLRIVLEHNCVKQNTVLQVTLAYFPAWFFQISQRYLSWNTIDNRQSKTQESVE